MIIESLHIHDFGGQTDRDVRFGEGINIIEGLNESGKSTVSAFIKFIFYGFSDKQERTRYYSFGKSSTSGTLTLRANGKRYRIERSYIENTGSKHEIIDLASNSPVFEGMTPEEIFLGVSSDVFTHTAYIGQSAGGYVNGSKVSGSIENILFSADENVDTEKALKRLDDARILLRHKKGRGGKIYELTDERDILIRRLDVAKQANAGIIEKEGTLRETKEAIEQNKAKLDAHSELIEYYETAKQYRTYKKYKTLKKKAAELEKVIETLKQSYTCEDFLPDEAYVQKLKDIADEISRLDETALELHRETEQQRAKNRDLFEMSMFIDKVNEKGGIESVAQQHNNIKKKRRTMNILAAVCFVLGIAAGAFCAVSYITTLLPSSYSIYFGAGALIMLVCGLIFIIGSSRQKINETEFLIELDIDNTKDFETAVSRFVTDENKLSIHHSKIDDLENKYEKVISARSEKEDAAMTEAMRWGKSNPDEALQKASEVLRLIAENTSEYEKFAMARDAFKTQVEGLDPAALKEKLAGRGYKEEDFDMEAVNAALRENDFYSKSSEYLKEKVTVLEKELAVLTATAEDPTELCDKINALDNKISILTKKNEAYLLAYEKLSEASTALRSSVAPKLAKNASALMDKLTGSRYDVLGIGRNLELKYEYDGQNRKIDYMSAGTRDLAYYSLRLALIRLLFKKQTPPAVFDESFARLDDIRLDNMLSVLDDCAKEGLQSLVFTSQKRDAEHMRAMGKPFNHIML